MGGTTEQKPERDCANQCAENRLLSMNGSEVCVRREEPLVPPCDGLPGSGAYFNP